MNGLSVVDGVPHIWGKPAIEDLEEPLLNCFSKWRCPHCNAHLSASGFICLNACHLTAPQYTEFMGLMRNTRAQIMNEFAIQAITPADITWYLNALGELADFKVRRRFKTQDAAEKFLEKSWPVLSKQPSGEKVKEHYLRLGFIIEVVNVQ